MFKQIWQKYQSLIFQFSRFVGIGFLNTGVDFTVINLLIALTGVTAGWKLSLLNSVSFVIAIIHSFFWNKYWAFNQTGETPVKSLVKVGSAGFVGVVFTLLALIGAGRQFSGVYFAVSILALFVCEAVLWMAFRLKISASGSSSSQQFSLFVGVSLVGTIINSGIVGLVTGFVPPLFGLNPKLWANMAKVAATAVALIWNFIGYKVLVFKK